MFLFRVGYGTPAKQVPQGWSGNSKAKRPLHFFGKPLIWVPAAGFV